VFYQLCNPPAGQTPSTSFTLEARHFPVWLDAQTLKISTAVAVWPQAKAGQQVDAAALGLKIAGATVQSWTATARIQRGTASVTGRPSARTRDANANRGRLRPGHPGAVLHDQARGGPPSQGRRRAFYPLAMRRKTPSR
jgi:hypothetical protein